MEENSLIKFLGTFNFVSRRTLTIVLYNFKITDRGRKISLKNFNGQLELDSFGIPYWKIYLQTTALITARCLGKAISEQLFKTKNSIDPMIAIYPLSNFQQCERKKLFLIRNSEFYPSHFSHSVLKFEELLKNELVKEAIKERPEKYQVLTKNS